MHRHQRLLIFGIIFHILALVFSMGFSHVALGKHGGGPGRQGQSDGSIGNPGAWGGLRPGGTEVGQPWSGPPGGSH
jgi:hypothetical protein